MTVQEYFAQVISVGGEEMTVGQFVREMLAEGHSRRNIDAYIIGALQRKEREERKS